MVCDHQWRNQGQQGELDARQSIRCQVTNKQPISIFLHLPLCKSIHFAFVFDRTAQSFGGCWLGTGNWCAIFPVLWLAVYLLSKKHNKAALYNVAHLSVSCLAIFIENFVATRS